MAIVGLKTWASSDALNTTNLNNDTTVLEAKFSAGITTADLSSSAGLVNAQLANSIYEVIVNLQGSSPAWAAATAGTAIAYASIPGTSSADGTYTGIAYSWFCTDCGAQTGKFRVEWGYINAAGAWTVVSTPIAATTLIANSAANDTGGAGGAAFSTAFTLGTSFVAAGLGPRVFALVMDTDDGTAISAEPGILAVTLKLKRTNGLRS